VRRIARAASARGGGRRLDPIKVVSQALEETRGIGKAAASTTTAKTQEETRLPNLPRLAGEARLMLIRRPNVTRRGGTGDALSMVEMPLGNIFDLDDTGNLIEKVYARASSRAEANPYVSMRREEVAVFRPLQFHADNRVAESAQCRSPVSAEVRACTLP
jgi:hypothetical protein